MGNFFCCMGKNQPQSILVDDPRISFISTQSITNLSVPSHFETVSTFTAHSSFAEDSFYKFSWYQLRSTYLSELQGNRDNKIKVQPQMLAVMNTIFTGIKNNIGPMSRTFYECLIEMDKSFPSQFEECAAKNQRSITEGKVLVERIRNHIVSMIHVHTIIINSLESGDTARVDKILKLIAVSHVIMKVKPNLFNLMDMVMAKFLARTGFLCEENAEAIVVYLAFVTNSIMNNVNLQQADNLGVASCSVARENYRLMKKWYAFLEEIHKQTSQLKDLDSTLKMSVIEPAPSHSTIPTEILKQDACIIKYFMKKKVNKDSVNNYQLFLGFLIQICSIGDAN